MSSLLDDLLETEPLEEDPEPPAKVALVRAPTADLEPEPKRKGRPLGFKSIARYVSKVTGNFEKAVDIAWGIAESDEVESKDRIKALEFLKTWGEANPATVRHVVSGPGGKPIQHLHGHVIAGGLTKEDLAKLTDEEIAEIRGKLKSARERDEAPVLSPRKIIDVDVEVDE